MLNRVAFKGKPKEGPPGMEAIIGGASAFGTTCLSEFHHLLVSPSSVTPAQRFAAMRSLVARLNVSLPGRHRKVFSFAPDQVGVPPTRLDVPRNPKEGGWSLAGEDYALLVDFNQTGLTLHRLLDTTADPGDVASTEAVDIPYAAIASVMRTGGGEAPQPPVWVFTLNGASHAAADVGTALCARPADEDDDLAPMLKAMAPGVRAQAVEAQKEARDGICSGSKRCLILRFSRTDAADLEARVVPTMLACNPDIVTTEPGAALGGASNGAAGGSGGGGHPGGIKMSTAVMQPRGARPATSGSFGAHGALLDSRRTALVDTAGTTAAGGVGVPAPGNHQPPPGLFDVLGGDVGLDSQAHEPMRLTAVLQAAAAAVPPSGHGGYHDDIIGTQFPRGTMLASQHDAALAAAVAGDDSGAMGGGLDESPPITDPALTGQVKATTRVTVPPQPGHAHGRDADVAPGAKKAALLLTTSAPPPPPPAAAKATKAAAGAKSGAAGAGTKRKGGAEVTPTTVEPPVRTVSVLPPTAPTGAVTGKRKAAVVAAAKLEKQAQRQTDGEEGDDDMDEEEEGPPRAHAATAPPQPRGGTQARAKAAPVTMPAAARAQPPPPPQQRGGAKADGGRDRAAVVVPPPPSSHHGGAAKQAGCAAGAGKAGPSGGKHRASAAALDALGGAGGGEYAPLSSPPQSESMPPELTLLAKQLFPEAMATDTEGDEDDDEDDIMAAAPASKKARVEKQPRRGGLEKQKAVPAKGGGQRHGGKGGGGDARRMELDFDLGAPLDSQTESDVFGTGTDDDSTVLALQRIVEAARAASQAAAKRTIGRMLDAVFNTISASVGALAERQATERTELARGCSHKVAELKRKRDAEQGELQACLKRFQAEIRARAAAVERMATDVAACAQEAQAAGAALAQKHGQQVARMHKELERHLAEKEAEARRVESDGKQNTGVKAAMIKLLKQL